MSISKKHALILIAVFILATILVEWAMGRLFFCKCDVISLWSGDIWSNQNSQQFADPYTFTHILHGVLFYFLIWIIRRKPLKFWTALVIAVFIESAWEIAENSSFIIDRYREVTISLDYYGDSILNSVSDIFAMMLGFWLAHRFNWKIVLPAAILLDVFLLLWLKDSLALNIIMLIYPIEAIKTWQMSGMPTP